MSIVKRLRILAELERTDESVQAVQKKAKPTGKKPAEDEPQIEKDTDK